MLIIGCDFHPSFQQIAYVDKETGEYGERRLGHREEAERFYRSLSGQGRKWEWKQRGTIVGSASC